MIRNFEYIIIVYKNRTETMSLHQSLNRMRIKNSIIPTPNQISASCGLSIKALYIDLNKILFCINTNYLSSNYQIYGEKKNITNSFFVKLK